MSAHAESTNIFDIVNLNLIFKNGRDPDAPIDERYRFYACKPTKVVHDKVKRMECYKGNFEETYTMSRGKYSRQIHIDNRSPEFADRAILMAKQKVYVEKIIEQTR